MTRSFALVATLCVLTASAMAADPKIQSAIQVFAATAADAGKLKTFCEMSEAMDAAGEKEDGAADAKIDGYMKQLGPEFQTAWNAGETVDENSADGKSLNNAIDALADKCSS